MESILAGERVFITGGGFGVGRACVELFLKEGAKVAFLDLDGRRVESVKSATGALGYTADIANRPAVQFAINEAAEKLGGLTALVNAASSTLGGPIAETTEQQLDRMYAVNLKGYYFATQAAIPHMLKAGRGSIVQVSSISAIKPAWGESYGIFNAGQVTLAFQAAMEHGPIIRANAILAGLLEDSPSAQMLYALPEFKAVLVDHPAQRLTRAAEVAQACLYFASTLSNSMNATVVTVDGGQTRPQPNLNAFFHASHPEGVKLLANLAK